MLTSLIVDIIKTAIVNEIEDNINEKEKNLVIVEDAEPDFDINKSNYNHK